MIFEWDEAKEAANVEKHGVSFELAKEAFFDIRRITAVDDAHSTETETRYYCFGEVNGKVLTVRFTLRDQKIRIYGAGFWRKGKAFYEERNGGIHG